MGQICCGRAAPKDAEQVRNESLNKQIKQERKTADDSIKLLLLGTGDSGKTTIFKQMRILFGDGYNEETRLALRGAIFNNLISGVHEVIRASLNGVAGRPIRGESLTAAHELLRVSENTPCDERIASLVAKLWDDPDFQETWADRSKYQVLDGWGEFARRACEYPKWGGPGWIPSVPDALLVRVRTTGIIEEVFHIDGFDFTLIDVGGQRNERRKWIHCFSEVTAVIFVVAISEYDQALFEAREKNRFEEALELFDSVVNAEWFARTNVVLFLNKKDIFKDKLCKRHIPLNASGLFPDAPKGFEFEPAVEWMKNRFISLNKDRNKSIFAHVTNATDTYNVQVVFDACKDAVLRDSLESMGMIS